MTQLDQLPPDQRAVLSLLLRQGKSYADVAGLLKIEPSAVRERAQSALAALGPSETDGLPDDRREDVGDYLLGQQPASQRATTRRFLEHSAPGRAWARVVASELRDVAPVDLPEIPAERQEVDDAFEALQERTAAREMDKRSSRRGGAVLLLGLAVVIAAVIVILLNTGGGSGNSNATVSGSSHSTSTSTSTTGTGTTSAAKPKIVAQLNFSPPDKSSHALAVANIIVQGSQKAFALQAQGLAPTNHFAYAVWLYNTPSDALPLGFIDQNVTAAGKASAVGALPANAAHYREIIITRETSSRPTTPGPIVLAAALSTGS